MSKLTTSAAARPGWLGAAGLLGLLALAWGCNWPAMKLVLQGVDVWLFRCSTAFGGGLLFMLALKLRRISLHLPRSEWKGVVFVAVFNVSIFPLSSVLALYYLPAGWAAIIAYTMPIWAAVMSFFVLGEKLTLRRLASLALGLVGLVVLVLPDLQAGADLSKLMIGVPIMLGGAILWAVGVVGQKYFTWSRPTSVIVAWQVLVGGIPFVFLSLALSDYGRLADIGPVAVLAWLYSVFIGLAAGTYLFYRIVAVFPVTVAGIGSLAVPVVGVFSSALLPDESLGLRELAALLLVVSAVALVLFERRRA